MDSSFADLVRAVDERDAAAVDAALAHGVSPDALTPDGYPVLMLAARDGDVGIVKRLLRAGASPWKTAPAWPPMNSTTLGGLTYLYADSPRSPGDQWRSVPLHTEQRAWLLRDGQPNSLYPDVRDVLPVPVPTALAAAAFEAHLDALEVLLAHARANAGQITEALVTAAHRGHVEIVQRLLGEPFEQETEYEECPLVQAAAQGHATLVTMLLDAGFDVDARAWEDRTALLAASQAGHLEVVRILLDRGADLHPEGCEHALAAAAGGGHAEVFGLLGRHTGDESIVAYLEPTLQTAIRHRDYRQRHASNEATRDLVQTIWDYDVPRFDRRMKDSTVDVNGVDLHGNRPLVTAARACSMHMVDALLRAGADPNLTEPPDPEGWRNDMTPLMCLIEAGPPSFVIKEPIIIRLVEAGAKLELRDIDGRSAMDRCWYGRTMPGFGGTAELLLRLGAEPPRED